MGKSDARSAKALTDNLLAAGRLVSEERERGRDEEESLVRTSLELSDGSMLSVADERAVLKHLHQMHRDGTVRRDVSVHPRESSTYLVHWTRVPARRSSAQSKETSIHASAYRLAAVSALSIELLNAGGLISVPMLHAAPPLSITGVHFIVVFIAIEAAETIGNIWRGTRGTQR